MIKRRASFEKLERSYLFTEMAFRKERFLKKHPQAKLINLGIGDTFLPLSPFVSETLSAFAKGLGTSEGYVGYGGVQGSLQLREKICAFYYPNRSVDEIFISDGAKGDISRLQTLFGKDLSIALQDPTYPVYLEGSIVQGIETIHLLPCLPDNNFFPTSVPKVDLLYICNPNNPTGVAYSFKALQSLVDWALHHHSLIIYDGAYSAYIQDPSLPKTIYEIPNAEKVAIEVNSFSKLAGFTGVRLGWTVVPKALTFDSGHLVWEDYFRLFSTVFNGPSNIAQEGGVAVFSKEGWKGVQDQVAYIIESARRLKKVFIDQGFVVYGGDHAPYLWVETPGRDSWDLFQEFLEKKGMIVTPGGGFGLSGNHFFRLSAFVHHSIIDEVIGRFSLSKCPLSI